MTYAPPTITALARYWTQHGGTNLGVVGDTRHVTKGRSYHLGRSQLTSDAYSRQTARDRAGLSDAASALDLGRLNGSLGGLRAFSRWLVERCQQNAPGTQDIREVIYTPDGKTVLRWDRERGLKSAPRPGEADLSHLTHTHVSWYRDSEKRAKVGAFAPFFEKPVQPAPPQENSMTTGNRLTDAIVTRAGYLANELKAGDNEAALAQLAKINEFTGRILVSIAGSPVDVNDPDEPLSSNADVARAQLRAAVGFPIEFDAEGNVKAIDAAALAAAATPEQQRELALLGVFGQIGTRDDVDYSLREQYFGFNDQGVEVLKSDTPDTLVSENPWETYLQGKG